MRALAPGGKPAATIRIWLEGRFTLLTCTAHLDELRATIQKPRVAELVKPHKAGRLVNQVKKHAEDINPLPRVARSRVMASMALAMPILSEAFRNLSFRKDPKKWPGAGNMPPFRTDTRPPGSMK